MILAQFFNDKRGITPLMGTFLLISFAVAVGVVVMSFGSAQVEEKAQCPIDINLKFAIIGGKEDICSTGSEVRFTIENGLNIPVEGLIVNIIGTESAQTAELDQVKMPKAGTYLGKVSFSGQIRQVKITPKVIFYDESQICSEKALIIENLGSC